jgi:carbon-monoxide dehydrogenase small subunit
MNLQAQGVPVAVSVNGTAQTSSVEPGLLLVDYLRDTLGLSGTKVGCETGQCGMCTVLLDGASVKSCAVLAAQTNGHAVITIEGLSPDGVLTPIQEKLWEMHAVQCGYCTPGMVVALTELLQQNAKPSEAEIRASLDGIMCRCGVYQNAIRAVQSVSATAGGG